MFLFSSLIQQSKNPSGFLGKRMMKLWNRAYLPMFVWAIRHLDRTFYPVILDVGVGNGRSTILLKENFPQSTITGIDISDTDVYKRQVPDGYTASVEGYNITNTHTPEKPTPGKPNEPGKPKKGGELPNTGSESNQVALVAGIALLGLGTGFLARRKKED